MSYNNPRLTFDMTALEAVMVFSEGNPGAVSVLARALKETPSIDPDCMFGGLGTIMGLDNLDIYGSKIWILYKDVCDENLSRMIGLLRANQLGHVTDQQFRELMSEGFRADRSLINAYLEEVTKQLPAFKLTTT